MAVLFAKLFSFFKIGKVFEDFTSDEIKNEYVIVITTDASYYLQQKKDGFLLLLLSEVCIFIFKPKHLEVPKILKIDAISEA